MAAQGRLRELSDLDSSHLEGPALLAQRRRRQCRQELCKQVVVPSVPLRQPVHERRQQGAQSLLLVFGRGYLRGVWLDCYYDFTHWRLPSSSSTRTARCTELEVLRPPARILLEVGCLRTAISLVTHSLMQ